MICHFDLTIWPLSFVYIRNIWTYIIMYMVRSRSAYKLTRHTEKLYTMSTFHTNNIERAFCLHTSVLTTGRPQKPDNFHGSVNTQIPTKNLFMRTNFKTRSKTVNISSPFIYSVFSMQHRPIPRSRSWLHDSLPYTVMIIFWVFV